MMNPFITTRPVTGKEFYGRENIIETIFVSTNSLILVIAVRKMGKSSLLQQLEQIAAGHDYVGLYFSLYGMDNFGRFKKGFSTNIKRRFKKIGLPPFDVSQDKEIFEIINSLDEFMTDQGKRLLFLIDEAEELLSLARQDYSAVRSLKNMLQHAERIKTVFTASQKFRKIDTPEYREDTECSPFLESFEILFLPPFDEKDSSRLIYQEQAKKRLVVADPLIEKIYQVSGGNPYFVQLVGMELFGKDNHLKDLTEKTLEQVRIKGNLVKYFEANYSALSDRQKEILDAVCCKNIRTSQALTKKLKIKPYDLSGDLSELTQLGYFTMKDENYETSNYFLKEWVENRDKIEQPKAQTTEIQESGEPKPQPKTFQELAIKILVSIWEWFKKIRTTYKVILIIFIVVILVLILLGWLGVFGQEVSNLIKTLVNKILEQIKAKKS